MEEKLITLYHRVMKRENFETAAKDLFDLLIAAQKKFPNKPRVLYVSIDGHRNAAGGFDEDMLELQKEFGRGFLAQFFTEVHFPLISDKNKEKQNNKIPDELQIFNANNKKDDSLNDLYIENYSNTEFQSEQDVYAHLQKISAFLKKYNQLDSHYALMDKEPYDPSGLLANWRLHLKDLIIELFNSFVHGNLISVAAMTRSLIESYVYLKVIKKEENARLLENWFLCSLIVGTKKYDKDNQDKILGILEQYCQDNSIDYLETYALLREGENSWLSTVIKKTNKQRISFKDACNYISESEVYNDFQDASSFVHGQDAISKMQPFLFYTSICHKFYTMMSYIFKAIKLYPITEEMAKEIDHLEVELAELMNKYKGCFDEI